MEGSELLADTLGDHVFEWFIRNKREEWDAYQAQVTQFELDRYLPAALTPTDRWTRSSASPPTSPPR